MKEENEIKLHQKSMKLIPAIISGIKTQNQFFDLLLTYNLYSEIIPINILLDSRNGNNKMLEVYQTMYDSSVNYLIQSGRNPFLKSEEKEIFEPITSREKEMFRKATTKDLYFYQKLYQDIIIGAKADIQFLELQQRNKVLLATDQAVLKIFGAKIKNFTSWLEVVNRELDNRCVNDMHTSIN